MQLFDIIGPVMIGPSSSHTAGLQRGKSSQRRVLFRQNSSSLYSAMALHSAWKPQRQ